MSSAVLEVVLVGCSGKKLAVEAPARELYTGNLFRACRAYAEARGGPWAILSAKHGLVMPDEYMAPYDFSMADLRAQKRGGVSSPSGNLEKWGRGVQRSLLARWPGAKFVFLAGNDYASCLAGYGTALVPGRTIASEPLKGMQVGERLSWLKRETAALASTPPGRVRTPGSCEACGVDLIDAARLCVSCRLAEERAENPELAEGACDFCGLEAPVAVSDQGRQRFAGDETSAQICGSCATWALEQLRGVPA